MELRNRSTWEWLYLFWMVGWALRGEYAILEMVVDVFCRRRFRFIFVDSWSLEVSRYILESCWFAWFDVVVGIALVIFAVSRCRKCVFLISSLMESTVLTISTQAFVGFLIVDVPWGLLSMAVWMIPLLSLCRSSAFGAGILKELIAATSLLPSLLKLC